VLEVEVLGPQQAYAFGAAPQRLVQFDRQLDATYMPTMAIGVNAGSEIIESG
jgi:hypothetical protein